MPTRQVRMKAFLKSLNEQVWNSVENGWSRQTSGDSSEGVVTPKEISSWSKDEINECSWNS